MSFSFTLFENETRESLSAAVDAKVAAMEPGDGKDEAEFLSSVIIDTIRQLSRGEVEFGSAYITGDVDNRKAQLNVNVSFKAPQPEPAVEPTEGS